MSDSYDSSWRGVPITQIYGAQTPWGAPEFPLVRPSSNHTVLYHIPSDGVLGEGPPKPQVGKDVWDQYNVRMPCSSHCLYPVKNGSGEQYLTKRWRLIETALSKPIRNSQELADAILSYNTKFKDRWKFRAVHKLFNKYLEKEETKYFFDVTLPEIAKLALELPQLIQAPIPLLKQHKNHAVSLSQHQISSLLANAFFCTFPRRNSTKRDSEYDTYPAINFSRLYESSASKNVLEKIKCLCHYFRRVCTKVPTGVVTVARRSVPPQRCPQWRTSTTPLSTLPVHTDSDVFIERADGLIQVDFANKYLGGGVLGHGCVQEEIRFTICPELIASMIFCQEMRPNEAVMIIGVEQYSEYTGYGGDFEWAGDHVDTTPYDSSGRRRCAVLAIDARSYSRDVTLQYEREHIDRELTKAWVGFSFFTADQPGMSFPGVATGNWGCGVYRGAPHLKSALQMMACAQAGRPMAYYTFEDVHLRDDIVNMHNVLVRYNVTVGQLYELILKYCAGARSQGVPEYLADALRRGAVADVPDCEPMDVSSEVLKEPTIEDRTDDNCSPDLFSEEHCSERSTQVTKLAYFTTTETGETSNGGSTEGTKAGTIELVDSDSDCQFTDRTAEKDVEKSGESYKWINNENQADKEENSSYIDNGKSLNKNNKSINECSQTSRLFEEMEKMDESNGKLNLNNTTNNTSFLDVSTTSLNNSLDNEHKIQIKLSSEAKKKLTGKITDYFSKKRT